MAKIYSCQNCLKYLWQNKCTSTNPFSPVRPGLLKLLERPVCTPLSTHRRSGCTLHFSSFLKSERFRSLAYIVFAGEPAKIMGGGGRPDRVNSTLFWTYRVSLFRPPFLKINGHLFLRKDEQNNEKKV